MVEEVLVPPPDVQPRDIEVSTLDAQPNIIAQEAPIVLKTHRRYREGKPSSAARSNGPGIFGDDQKGFRSISGTER